MREWQSTCLDVLRRPAIRPSRLLGWRASSSAANKTIADVLNGALRPAETQVLTVSGFVRSIRKQKRVAFASVSDGSCLEPLQAVLDPSQTENLTNGSAVTLTGSWRRSSGGDQAYELHVDHAQVVGENDVSHYPIQKKYHTPEFLRTVPHLRARTPLNALLLRLRSKMISSATNFFESQSFVQTHTPIITSSDCEGAGEVFTAVPKTALGKTRISHTSSSQPEFFGSPKYLTVSAQLHLEALAQSVEKVWTLSPTFRAEQSNTPRHLSEFYMLEAEQSFVQNLETVMNLVEGLVKSLTRDLTGSNLSKELLLYQKEASSSQENPVDWIDLQKRWDGALASEWPRITYHEAVRRLLSAVTEGRAHFESTIDETSGLQTEHERFLAQDVGMGSPVFVKEYPKAMKPFYMPSTKEDSSTVECFDLLAPGTCEVAGGSLREHRLTPMLENMKQKGLMDVGPEPGRESAVAGGLEWYLDLRRYGSVPHGGFGLGFDRLLGYLSGVSNVRDVSTFPRWHGRCSC